MTSHDHCSDSRQVEVESRHIDPAIGVRLRGSSRVMFFLAGDSSIVVGTWVLVRTHQGEQAARVVIAPHQMALAQLPGSIPPIIGTLRSEADERIDDLPPATIHNVDNEVSPDRRLIGGLGKSGHFLASSSEAPNASDVSYENVQYRKMKQDLPRLGQRVGTREGEGSVVSVQVFKKLVTVRYDDPAREQTYAVADVLPGIPEVPQELL